MFADIFKEKNFGMFGHRFSRMYSIYLDEVSEKWLSYWRKVFKHEFKIDLTARTLLT